VGSLSRKRYTQYTLNNTERDTAKTKVKTGRGPIMEEMLCDMALKSSNGRGRHTTHYLATACAVSGR
jgi:hypothetical protein